MKTTKKLLWICLLVLAAHAVRADIELDHNQTYVFDYNGTGNETFHCAEINTSAACTQRNITLNLNPGEYITKTFPEASVTASCAVQNVTADQKCIINRDLDPGDTFELKNAACDVVIDVEEAQEESCAQADSYEHTAKVSVDKNAEQFTLKIQNRTYTVPPNDEPFSYTFDLKHTCPREFRPSKEEDREALMRVCEEFSPLYYAEYLRPTLTACQNQAERYVEDVKNLGHKEDNAREDLSQCRSDLAASNQTVADLQRQVNEAERDLGRAQNKASFRAILASVFAIWAAIASGIAAWMIILNFRIRRNNQ